MSSFAARFLAPPPRGFFTPPAAFAGLGAAFPGKGAGGCSVMGVGGWLNLSLIMLLFGSLALAEGGAAVVGVGCWLALAPPSGDDAVGLSLRVGIAGERSVS